MSMYELLSHRDQTFEWYTFMCPALNIQSDAHGPALHSPLLQGTSMAWPFFDWRRCCVLQVCIFYFLRSLFSPASYPWSYTCNPSTQKGELE